MRHAEILANSFQLNQYGKSILHDTILSDIAHINYYTPDEDNAIKFEHLHPDKKLELEYSQCYIYTPVIKNILDHQNHIDGVVGYASPGYGKASERFVGGDTIGVPIYNIGSSIDWMEKYDTKEQIVIRAFQVLENSYVKKVLDDVFHCLLATGTNRNIMCFENQKKVFSTELIDIMKKVAKDNGSYLTHIIVSPEAYQDVSSIENAAWDVIHNVHIISIDDLGKGCEYQNFFEEKLEGEVESDCTELVIGISNDQDGAMFVQPTTDLLQFKLLDKFTNPEGITRYGVEFGREGNECGMGFVCEPNKVLLGCF